MSRKLLKIWYNCLGQDKVIIPLNILLIILIILQARLAGKEIHKTISPVSLTTIEKETDTKLDSDTTNTEIQYTIKIYDNNDFDIDEQLNDDIDFIRFENLTKDLKYLKDKRALYDTIKTYSDKYDVEWELIAAILYSETRFKENTNHKNSKVIGMGGIHSGVWVNELKKASVIQSKKDLYDTDINIEATCYIISKFLNRYNNNVKEALHSYKGRGFDKKLNISGKQAAMTTYEVYSDLVKDNNNDRNEKKL